ncbi:MAG TPA: glycosyltransferase family 39 protein, partial [Limnochordales bacterium]
MRDLLLLFLIVALVYGFGLGRASLWDAEEGIYAEIIRQMAQSGDWVVPVYNGAPRFDQPPLMLWIGALAVRALGPTELAVRLGSFVLALLSVALVYAFGRRLHSRGAGVIAALVLPATLAWFMMGRMGVMDTGLSFFVGLSVYQLARIADAVAPARFGARTGLAGPYFWLGVATALSVLAKGPAALLLVGGTALFFFGPRRLGKLLWR